MSIFPFKLCVEFLPYLEVYISTLLFVVEFTIEQDTECKLVKI